MKVFGIELFGKKKALADQILEGTRLNKYLPDFYNTGRRWEADAMESVLVQEVDKLVGKTKTVVPTKRKRGRPAKKLDLQVTPKGFYEMKFLDEKDTFSFNTDPAYIDQQLADFNYRKTLIKGNQYEMGNGIKEIESILIRMQNRKLYPEF